MRILARTTASEIALVDPGHVGLDDRFWICACPHLLHHPTTEMRTGTNPEAGRSTPQPILPSSEKLNAQGLLETVMLVTVLASLSRYTDDGLLFLQAYTHGGRLWSRQHDLVSF